MKLRREWQRQLAFGEQREASSQFDTLRKITRYIYGLEAAFQ